MNDRRMSVASVIGHQTSLSWTLTAVTKNPIPLCAARVLDALEMADLGGGRVQRIGPLLTALESPRIGRLPDFRNLKRQNNSP